MTRYLTAVRQEVNTSISESSIEVQEIELAMNLAFAQKVENFDVVAFSRDSAFNYAFEPILRSFVKLR